MARMEKRLTAPVLTAQEHRDATLTKARWMVLRDQLSSTHSLGFRVDAMRTRHGHLTAFDSDLFRVDDADGVLTALHAFLPRASECHEGVHPRDLAQTIAKRLKELQVRSQPPHRVDPVALASSHLGARLRM